MVEDLILIYCDMGPRKHFHMNKKNNQTIQQYLK